MKLLIESIILARHLDVSNQLDEVPDDQLSRFKEMSLGFRLFHIFKLLRRTEGNNGLLTKLTHFILEKFSAASVQFIDKPRMSKSSARDKN